MDTSQLDTIVLTSQTKQKLYENQRKTWRDHIGLTNQKMGRGLQLAGKK